MRSLSWLIKPGYKSRPELPGEASRRRRRGRALGVLSHLPWWMGSRAGTWAERIQERPGDPSHGGLLFSDLRIRMQIVLSWVNIYHTDRLLKSKVISSNILNCPSELLHDLQECDLHVWKHLHDLSVFNVTWAFSAHPAQNAQSANFVHDWKCKLCASLKHSLHFRPIWPLLHNSDLGAAAEARAHFHPGLHLGGKPIRCWRGPNLIEYLS